MVRHAADSTKELPSVIIVEPTRIDRAFERLCGGIDRVESPTVREYLDGAVILGILLVAPVIQAAEEIVDRVRSKQ